MPDPTPSQRIAALHAEYEKLTGITIRLMGREQAWWEWLKAGFTVADLRELVAQRKERIKVGQLTPYSLSFRILVGDLERSEEDIAMIRAAAEKRRKLAARPGQPNLRMPLANGHRPPDETPQAAPARSAAEILKEAEALKEFREMRDKL